jgi:hypothetical protein
MERASDELDNVGVLEAAKQRDLANRRRRQSIVFELEANLLESEHLVGLCTRMNECSKRKPE